MGVITSLKKINIPIYIYLEMDYISMQFKETIFQRMQIKIIQTLREMKTFKIIDLIK